MTDESTIDQEAVDVTGGKERSAPKRARIWNRCGVPCAVCGKDQWWVFQGFNRCECGQVLWVERVRTENGDTRFPYRQGAALPANYPGWSDATK